MADPSPDINSVRSIITNADYLSNWITTVVVAASFSALISMKDKLTGAAIFLSFSASSLLAIAGWPLLLQYGYGGLGTSIGYGVVCGVAGMTILMTLIGVIRRFYNRRNDIGDAALNKVGVPPATQGQNP